MATLTPFYLVPSDPGTRQWLSYGPTTYNLYVFVVNQARDHEGNWSDYFAGWSTYNLWYQTQVYGARLYAPNVLVGSPFKEWDDMTAACQAVLDTLS